MYRVSDRFLAALPGSHTMVTRVDAYLGAARVATDLPVVDGSVAVNSGSGARRKLDLTLADPRLWDTLSPLGIELAVSRGIRFPDGSKEMVPLGRFPLDSASTPVIARGNLTFSAGDRWSTVKRARFELPRVSTAGLTNIQQAIRLAGEAVPTTPDTSGVSAANVLAATKVGVLVWDRDRDTAITDLATAAGCEIYFGASGQLVVRDTAVLGPAAGWRVEAGRHGVMVSGTATRDRSNVYNVVVVVSSKTDGTAPFTPQTAADTDPDSPTNVAGPFNRVPYVYTTSLIGTAADAAALAKNLLAQVRGRYIDMAAESIVNPALESGDTISVTGVDGNARLYLLDSFTVPLGVTATMSLTLRSLAAVTSNAGQDTSTTTSTTTSSS